ncbi:hypothetical protein EAG_11460 [Camponotus floridanus]|uniref:Uncharacterized protein n=1 Tax=Camponotus floridanus TaxID=104421 RepID=E2A9P0_CAMFO|nr:hypothetical protein EAG_11460 [Camponotus floridanus]
MTDGRNGAGRSGGNALYASMNAFHASITKHASLTKTSRELLGEARAAQKGGEDESPPENARGQMGTLSRLCRPVPGATGRGRSEDLSHYGVEFMPDAQRHDKLPLMNGPTAHLLALHNEDKEERWGTEERETRKERSPVPPTAETSVRNQDQSEGFERLQIPPVAKNGRLQRSWRLHHRYRVLITANRLDVMPLHPSKVHPSFYPPLFILLHNFFDLQRKDISSSIRILILFKILRRGPTTDKIYCTAHFAREDFRETRLPGEPQLSHTEISRNRANTNDAEEEEEKFHHTGVFRGSWRKKMGKVFICGLPLRSGPMAALNRSQLRGVGSYLSSRGVGRKSASRRTTC